MEIRAIIMDLDGTALRPDRVSFSARLEAALLEAHRRGVAIVPATGRQQSLLPPPLLGNPAWSGIAVLCNGAEIRRLATGELLDARYMTAAHLTPLVQAAKRLGIAIELSSGGQLYLTADSWEVSRRRESLRFHLGVLERVGRQVECLETFLAGTELAFEKVNLPYLPPETRKKILSVLAALPLSGVFSGPGAMEVTHREATKAHGLRTACRLLGIDPAHTMAIGDSGNDISMLQAAGLGVAMGDAPEEVRRAARAVTGSNPDDGAAQAIERYVLGAAGPAEI